MKVIDERTEVKTEDILTCQQDQDMISPVTTKVTLTKPLNSAKVAHPVTIRGELERQKSERKIASNESVKSVQDAASIERR
jgi:hypothetical protein